MNPKFLLNDVVLRKVKTPRTIVNPVYASGYWQINQHEFAMQVESIGSFYACNGNEIEYAPAKNATPESVELYLNGSVYGAILHQRNILPLHGSSFVWKKRGILLCGESGAGKSSLTAAFCFAGAEFLTDDVTPFVFENDRPVIIPLSDRIKLWNDSLQQLNQKNRNLNAIYPGQEKYYFPMQNELHQKYPLHQMYFIEVSEKDKIEFTELDGVQLFAALRNEIYRWEYLSSMPETEISYIQQLLSFTRKVSAYRVHRPRDIKIEEMAGHLRKHLNEKSVNTNEVAPKIL